MTAPACPHVDADEQPTCKEPMRPVGAGVFECPNHHGETVTQRLPRAYPDIPRDKRLAKKYAATGGAA